MHFGKTLKNIREKSNISKKQISDDLNISLDTLEVLERSSVSPNDILRDRVIEYYFQKGIMIELPPVSNAQCDYQSQAVVNAGLVGAQTEVVQRYGSANKEHIVALIGIDNETGEEFAKSLKKINNSKISKDHYNLHLKQQSGFSAEVKTVARDNAEMIIAGEKKMKSKRTDDISRQSDGKGNSIGGKNDELYDIAIVNKSGVYMEGTARQLKFIGGTPENCTKIILNSNFDKYRDADVVIEVPSDFYDSVKNQLNEMAEEMKRQIEIAEVNGDIDKVILKKAKLTKIVKTSDNLKRGKVSNKEAIEARLRPILSTTKDILGISHQAGYEAAKSGAVIGGGISFIRNSVSVIKGNKDASKAALEVVGDTTKAASMSYAVAFVGSALKGSMLNAPTEYVRFLSKTNLPAIVVTVALETSKSLSRYAKGEIDGLECFNELGERGTGMLASATGASVGQVLIPIPVVGGLVGGMIGYAMASAYYYNLASALNDAKLAHEERLYIEAECRETIIAIRNYHLEIELVINNYLKEYSKVFEEAFLFMSQAYTTNDVDKFIEGANKVVLQLSGKPSFENKSQFDVLMSNVSIIEI